MSTKSVMEALASADTTVITKSEVLKRVEGLEMLIDY